VLASGAPHLPFGPRRLNLCFDRSCNLACPSCRHGVHRREHAEHLERLAVLGPLVAGVAG